MKKKVIVFVLVVIVALCCFGFTACDSSGISGIEITAYTNGVAETYKAGINKTVKINTDVKKGYYLKGYYSQESGGEKYFDYKGESVSVWSKSFPTVFYAQWEKINGYESFIEYDEKTYTFYSNIKKFFYYALDDEAINAIKANFDTTVQITFSGKIKSSDVITVRFQDSDGDGAELFYKEVLSDYTPSGNYVDFHVVAICSARIFKSEYKVHITLHGDSASAWDSGKTSVKDQSVSFKVL